MIPFWKFQGTGNDFVIIDQRETQWIQKNRDEALVKRICDRKFGIGADGLMLLENHPDYDFQMIYFNADGNESTMCGNGGRCLVNFANLMGIKKDTYSFIAIDGPHKAVLSENNWVELQMIDLDSITIGEDYYELNTGSPHYIIFVEDVDDINIKETGSAIRYSEPYAKEGINVNFVERTDDGIIVATYERGVEDETLSCGTGVTAAAIALYYKNKVQEENFETAIVTKGGNLSVKFEKATDNKVAVNVWLGGPATPVFKGVIEP